MNISEFLKLSEEISQLKNATEQMLQDTVYNSKDHARLSYDYDHSELALMALYTFFVLQQQLFQNRKYKSNRKTKRSKRS